MRAARLAGFAALLGVTGAAGAAADAPGPAAGAGAKPWEKTNDCDWWLSRDDGVSLRASIGTGDGDLVLTLADPAFAAWSEEDRPTVELRFNGDAAQRIEAEGWASHGGGPWGMFGINLGIEGRRLIGRATRIELRRGGSLIVDLPLAGTPSHAELEACVPMPESESSDVE